MTDNDPQISIIRVAGGRLPSALADDWNRLAGDIPCRRWEWLAPWWRHYARPADQLLVLVLRSSAGRTVGICPWYVRRTLRHGRVVRFLGSGDVCSDYLTLFVEPGAETPCLNAVADWLAGAGRDEWDLLELAGVDAHDPLVQGLVDRLASADMRFHQRPGESCWRLALPNSWDEFLKTLSRSKRDKVRKLDRRYFETGRASVSSPATLADLEPAFATLVDLHQKRRRSLGQPGCFADPAFTHFHRESSDRFFACGALRLRTLTLDAAPAACEYGLIGGRTVYFYQSGLDPALLDHHPGWLGTISSLRDAISAGYAAYDFMRGDEAYKASWGAQPHPTVETRIIGRRRAAHLRHAAWRAEQGLRSWARRRLKPTS